MALETSIIAFSLDNTLTPEATGSNITVSASTASAAGADLYAWLDRSVSIEPGKTAFIPAGIALEVPEGCAGLIYARSSLGTKRGLAPANKVGVIDSDYRGPVTVVLYNHGNEPQTIAHGERIAQMVIARYEKVEWVEVEQLSESERGAGGFGSTGKK